MLKIWEISLKQIIKQTDKQTKRWDKRKGHHVLKIWGKWEKDIMCQKIWEISRSHVTSSSVGNRCFDFTHINPSFCPWISASDRVSAFWQKMFSLCTSETLIS